MRICHGRSKISAGRWYARVAGVVGLVGLLAAVHADRTAAHPVFAVRPKPPTVVVIADDAPLSLRARGVEVDVLDATGRIVGHAIPDADHPDTDPSKSPLAKYLPPRGLFYRLDRPLPSGPSRYTFVARAAGSTGSTVYLGSDVPPDMPEPMAGTLFVATTSDVPGVPRGGSLRYVDSTTTGSRFSVVDGGVVREVTVTRASVAYEPDVARVVTDAESLAAARDYVHVPVGAEALSFLCADPTLTDGRGTRRYRLQPGATLRVTSIVRAAHVAEWVPNEVRRATYGDGCGGDCGDGTGVFVDSPFYVTVAARASDLIGEIDVAGLDQPEPVHDCETGLIVFQDTEQLRATLVAAPTAAYLRAQREAQRELVALEPTVEAIATAGPRLHVYGVISAKATKIYGASIKRDASVKRDAFTPDGGAGAYRIEGEAADGTRLFSLSFARYELFMEPEHLGTGEPFSFDVPVTNATIARLATITVYAHGRRTDVAYPCAAEGCSR